MSNTKSASGPQAAAAGRPHEPRPFDPQRGTFRNEMVRWPAHRPSYLDEGSVPQWWSFSTEVYIPPAVKVRL